MTAPITGGYRASDGRIVTTCRCGWWSDGTNPGGALVALREHQADTGHDDQGDEE